MITRPSIDGEAPGEQAVLLRVQRLAPIKGGLQRLSIRRPSLDAANALTICRDNHAARNSANIALI